MRCLLDGLRMEEIGVRMYFVQYSHIDQHVVLQKIKDQIYDHFKIKDSASQGNLDGEDKLKLKSILLLYTVNL